MLVSYLTGQLDKMEKAMEMLVYHFSMAGELKEKE